MHRGRRAARESEGGLPRTGSWDATAAHAHAQKRRHTPSQKDEYKIMDDNSPHHMPTTTPSTMPSTPLPAMLEYFLNDNCEPA